VTSQLLSAVREISRSHEMNAGKDIYMSILSRALTPCSTVDVQSLSHVMEQVGFSET
jgi:hypothetical protein